MGTLSYIVNSTPSWATWHPISKKICFSWWYSLKWAHATTTSQIKLLAREESFILSVLLRSVFSAAASWSYPHAAISPGFITQTQVLLSPIPACLLFVIESQRLSAFSCTSSSDILTSLHNILCTHYGSTHLLIAIASWQPTKWLLSQYTKGRHISCYFTCLSPSCSFPGMYIIFWAVLSKTFLRLR